MKITRRSSARLGSLIAILLLVPTLLAPIADAAGVKLTLVAGGLDQPDFVTGAGDGSNRLFIVEKVGRIRLIKNGVLQSKVFLDIRSSVSKGDEQGLLGLAFHPDFKHNGRFYVDFTDPKGNTAINEYRVFSSNHDVANPASGRRILSIGQPYSNHNGGMLAFGPDGYLYIGMGDGGSGGDPGNRAQSLGSRLCKLLLIKINGTTGSRQYRIPSSNPYVGRTGLDEIWARGLRNPWRFSFDKANGDLWIGDVGQDRFEEIDRSTNASGRGRGANYGWRVVEGRHCYNPSSGCNRSGKVSPLVEYAHSGGCAVTGGYVYRGSAVAALAGRYLFADFCSGTIWTISRTAVTPASPAVLMQTSMSIASFGQDDHGELYVVDLGGSVYRIDAA